MLSKRRLIGMLVGLARVNDIGLIDDPAVLNHDVCAVGDILLVRRLAAVVSELFNTFDYAKSPEFLRLVEGKSAQVRAMQMKMITPQRRTEMRKRLGKALAMVMESNEVLELIASTRHDRIRELRNLLLEVSNPDEPFTA